MSAGQAVVRSAMTSVTHTVGSAIAREILGRPGGEIR
jgi:hypothetical protein